MMDSTASAELNLLKEVNSVPGAVVDQNFRMVSYTESTLSQVYHQVTTNLTFLETDFLKLVPNGSRLEDVAASIHAHT